MYAPGNLPDDPGGAGDTTSINQHIFAARIRGRGIAAAGRGKAGGKGVPMIQCERCGGFGHYADTCTSETHGGWTPLEWFRWNQGQ